RRARSDEDGDAAGLAVRGRRREAARRRGRPGRRRRGRRRARGMKVRLTEDPASFLDQARALLLEEEARNNLILGVAATLVDSPDRFTEKRFWVVTDGGETVAAAMRTAPFNLVLGRPRNAAALAALVAGIEEDLPGVVAAHPEVDEFVRLWSQTHAIEPRTLR